MRKHNPVNQAKVFNAFQQAGWPPTIRNPFLPETDELTEHSEGEDREHLEEAVKSCDADQKKGEARDLLSETVKSCNRSQRKPLLHFSDSRSGDTVSWKKLKSPPGT